MAYYIVDYVNSRTRDRTVYLVYVIYTPPADND